MMILARLMSGAFFGAEYTLAPAYFSESYDEYLAVLKELGEKEKRRVKTKDVLNAAHAISMTVGTAVGTGELYTFSTFIQKLYVHVALIN